MNKMKKNMNKKEKEIEDALSMDLSKFAVPKFIEESGAKNALLFTAGGMAMLQAVQLQCMKLVEKHRGDLVTWNMVVDILDELNEQIDENKYE